MIKEILLDIKDKLGDIDLIESHVFPDLKSNEYTILYLVKYQGNHYFIKFSNEYLYLENEYNQEDIIQIKGVFAPAGVPLQV